MFDLATHTDRRRRVHDAVSDRLAALDDQALEALIREAASQQTNVRGGWAVFELDGVQVFAKLVPLTNLERANLRSTTNMFGLPLYYQYGVGSTGFGVWRELAANVMATDWVLSGACVNFPLLYHWRVLPRVPPLPLTPEQQARLDESITYWNGSAAIRARREAIIAADASLVMFIEHVPELINAWLEGRIAEGGEAAEAAIAKVDGQLTEVARFINARSMLHFDLHFQNILTDGELAYVTDFGLATCSGFELSAAERAFFEQHRHYDRAYIAMYLVRWLEGLDPPANLSPRCAALIERYRPIEAVMGRFINQLRDGSKTTPYPAAELDRAARTASSGTRPDLIEPRPQAGLSNCLDRDCVRILAVVETGTVMSSESEIRALAKRFFDAVEAGDIDTVFATYSADARIWHNTDGAEQTRDDNAATLKGFVRQHDLQPAPGDDPPPAAFSTGGFVHQHTLRGTRPDGVAVSLDACIVCAVEDGRITRLDEYFDSAQVAAFTARA